MSYKSILYYVKLISTICIASATMRVFTSSAKEDVFRFDDSLAKSCFYWTWTHVTISFLHSSGQHTSVNIVDYLSLDTSAVIRDSVLDRLASSSSSIVLEDPLTRIALFDLIAETVLASPTTDRPGKKSVSFLRFLTPSPTHSVGLLKTRSTRPDCLDCCMTALNKIKVNRLEYTIFAVVRTSARPHWFTSSMVWMSKSMAYASWLYWCMQFAGLLWVGISKTRAD